MIINIFIFFLILNFFYLFSLVYYPFKKVCDYKILSLSEKLLISIISITFISIFFNFFLPIKYLKYFLIIFVIFLIIRYKNNINFKEIKKIFLISIFFSPFAFFLNAGVDGALYHLPHQLLLFEDKISLGIVNLHSRYGLISSINYLKSIFLQKNNMILIANVTLIIYAIFFLHIYESLKKNLYFYLYLPIILTFFIYSRYSVPTYALVDFALSIFFILSFFFGIKCLDKKSENKFKNNFFLFIFFSIFCGTLKASGVIIYFYVFLIVLVKRKIILKNFGEYIYIFVFIIFFNLLWILKNLLNTSCIIYPINFLCFDLNIAPKNYLILNTIKDWARAPFFILENLNLYKIFFEIDSKFYLLITLLIIFIVVLKKYKPKILHIVYLSGLIFINFWSDELKGIYYNIFNKNFYLVEKFFFKELIILFLLNIIVFLYLSEKIQFKLNRFIDNLSIKIIPFLFYLISVIFWLITAPSPRLGQHYFLLFIPVFFYIVSSNFNCTEDFKNFKKTIFIYIFFSVFSMPIFNKPVKIVDLFYFDIKPDFPQVEKRKEFGFKPLDDNINSCWLIKDCYSSKKDVKQLNLLFNYKKYILIN
jgi:hypothetical protein